MAIVRFVYLLALGLWIGEIAFFSFVAAPATFHVLGPVRGGDVVGAIFPRYYALGVTTGMVAVGGALVLARRAADAGLWSAALLALTLGVAATAWAGYGIQPRAQRLRATVVGPVADSPVAAEFGRLHGWAVILNGTSLLAALVGLGCSAGALRS